MVGLAAAFACAEGFAPGARVSLAIVPLFSEAAPGVLSGDLDALHIRVTRITRGTEVPSIVIDTTVAVDTAGGVDLPLTVPLLADPEEFEILLEGVRSSDNAVLYSGIDTVRIFAGSATPPPIEIPVSYVGPCQVTSGCQVTVGPQGASLVQGDSVLMTALVDSVGIPVAGVPVSLINLDTALVRVGSTRYVVARTATPGGTARIVADVRSDADTLFLTVYPAGGPPPVPPPPVTFAGDSTDGVAFNSGVFRVNRDGSTRFRLNDRGRVGDVHPRWSPDRRRVAFTADDQLGGPNALFIVAETGDTFAAVVADSSARRPRWSPDGVHVAFECGDGFSAGQDVCVLPDVRGAIPTLNRLEAQRVFVTDSTGSRLDGPASFAWDPTDAKRLIVVRDSVTASGLASRLWTVGFDGRTPLPLSPAMMDVGKGPLTIAGPLDVTSDGATIVFAASDSTFSRKLYLIARDGSGLRQLTSSTAFDDRPVFSPDGRQVLFIRDSSCSVDYWRVNVQSGVETQVSAEGWCDFNSSVLGHDWSPDGKDIVLVGGEPPGGFADTRIYRVPAGTTAATYLQDRRLIGRASDAGAFVRDIQPSWRP